MTSPSGFFFFAPVVNPVGVDDDCLRGLTGLVRARDGTRRRFVWVLAARRAREGGDQNVRRGRAVARRGRPAGDVDAAAQRRLDRTRGRALDPDRPERRGQDDPPPFFFYGYGDHR